MELLFKREQTSSRFFKVKFKLWGKIDLTDEERALSQRYNLGEACLIAEFEPKLFRNTGLFGLFVAAVVYIIGQTFISDGLLSFFMLIAGIMGGFWFFNQYRETIFVKDLLHGRHFSCLSIVALARKEAWLEDRVLVLRQVLESAKHWDGTEHIMIDALPKKEAKELMLAAA